MSRLPRTARAMGETRPRHDFARAATATNGVVPQGSFDHAWCSLCDWCGPARRARASARHDLDRHLVARHSSAQQ